jgi:phosphoribosylaminoimidazolecarboxamide formyltransferase/IMP cyclohydrolase
MPTALLSVYDKSGLVPFARGLADRGFRLLSTGGSARALRDAGVPVDDVAGITGFPEILDGRVKTLHPRIHGGLLARATPEHRAELSAHGIDEIDLVACNLYPFRETVARPDVDHDEALEQIDIGGPTMLRAAAKNHPRVLVLVDPSDYAGALTALDGGGPDPELRRSLARKAFAHTAAYDAAIVGWLDRDALLPDSLHLTLERAQTLRYGENPHQVGARYRREGGGGVWDGVVQHKGLALSYLNLFDADAAWRLVHTFDAPACVIVKHANPCGVALGDDIADAYTRAFACDPLSAFGGVVALNRPMSFDTADALMGNAKADVVIAPGYSPEALERLMAKRKTMRLLEASPPGSERLTLRGIDGGFLVQPPDRVTLDRSAWRVVTEAQPTEAQWRDLELAWQVCAVTQSNAIVLTKDGQAVGIGAGQQSRVDAGLLAARKADGRAVGGACASDAFYPFRDGLDAAADAGCAAVIQPGGSIRDDELIAAANEHGMAMVFTGERHFRH